MEDLVTHKEYRYQTSKVKLSVLDPPVVDPHDVARHDCLEQFVEEIYVRQW